MSLGIIQAKGISPLIHLAIDAILATLGIALATLGSFALFTLIEQSV
jgi:hypothetical protein